MAIPKNLSIFEKFNFETPPIGIKYLLHKPEGIKQTDKKLNFCEFVREAQLTEAPFYFTKDNEVCFGTFVLGWADFPRFAEGGLIGPDLEIFDQPRANTRIYQGLPRIPNGTVNYVALSTLNKLTFDPDVLVIMANANQAEVILRAMSYTTGEPWETKTRGVVACSYAFVYPYQSGKVNYTVTGLSMGMKSYEVFPEGWILISIPYNWIPIITENLKKMKWVLTAYELGREKFLQTKEARHEKLRRESFNP